MVPWGHANQPPKWHLNRFSRFCMTHSVDQHTDRQTTLHATSVANGCIFLPDCLHGLLPGPFLLSYSVFVFSLSLFFVSVPCASLGWLSRQLLSDINTVYRVVSMQCMRCALVTITSFTVNPANKSHNITHDLLAQKQHSCILCVKKQQQTKIADIASQ